MKNAMAEIATGTYEAEHKIRDGRCSDHHSGLYSIAGTW